MGAAIERKFNSIRRWFSGNHYTPPGSRWAVLACREGYRLGRGSNVHGKLCRGWGRRR